MHARLHGDASLRAVDIGVGDQVADRLDDLLEQVALDETSLKHGAARRTHGGVRGRATVPAGAPREATHVKGCESFRSGGSVVVGGVLLWWCFE